jgi:hypothetical protein
MERGLAQMPSGARTTRPFVIFLLNETLAILPSLKLESGIWNLKA